MSELEIANYYPVNTPFFEEDYFETDDYSEDQPSYRLNNVGQRMIIILIFVPIIAFALGSLAGPVRGKTANSANIVSPTNDQIGDISVQVGDTSMKENSPDVVASGSIAPFFTPEVQYWESKIVEWANIQGVDPNAVATIMQIESCGNPQAVSSAGARGLFQVMPFHFSNNEDMLDPDTNATRGLNFFNEQLRYTSGNVYLSFAGYNGGYAASGGAYENWANETQRYYNWAKGIYDDAQAGLDRSETLEAWLTAGGAAGCQIAANQLNIN